MSKNVKVYTDNAEPKDLPGTGNSFGKLFSSSSSESKEDADKKFKENYLANKINDIGIKSGLDENVLNELLKKSKKVRSCNVNKSGCVNYNIIVSPDYLNDDAKQKRRDQKIEIADAIGEKGKYSEHNDEKDTARTATKLISTQKEILGEKQRILGEQQRILVGQRFTINLLLEEKDTLNTIMKNNKNLSVTEKNELMTTVSELQSNIDILSETLENEKKIKTTSLSLGERPQSLAHGVNEGQPNSTLSSSSHDLNEKVGADLVHEPPQISERTKMINTYYMQHPEQIKAGDELIIQLGDKPPEESVVITDSDLKGFERIPFQKQYTVPRSIHAVKVSEGKVLTLCKDGSICHSTPDYSNLKTTTIETPRTTETPRSSGFTSESTTSNFFVSKQDSNCFAFGCQSGNILLYLSVEGEPFVIKAAQRMIVYVTFITW